MIFEWLFGQNSASHAKSLENLLSSLTSPLLNALQMGYTQARSFPNITFFSLIVLTGGSYIIYRKFKKPTLSADLSALRTASNRAQQALDLHTQILLRQTKAMTLFANKLAAIHQILRAMQTTTKQHDETLQGLEKNERLAFLALGDSLQSIKRALNNLGDNTKLTVPVGSEKVPTSGQRYKS